MVLQPLIAQGGNLKVAHRHVAISIVLAYGPLLENFRQDNDMPLAMVLRWVAQQARG
ncbi:hypothetical protein [Massilia psychrophila]|uniref:hypothetical protein n=1 Tax=Massilia psychrophila TaxID=1603353 RepID=UPI0015D50A93|nr:hypothetical protein [Massilia psychrophila]